MAAEEEDFELPEWVVVLYFLLLALLRRIIDIVLVVLAVLVLCCIFGYCTRFIEAMEEAALGFKRRACYYTTDPLHRWYSCASSCAPERCSSLSV